jgi:hypothetical protein
MSSDSVDDGRARFIDLLNAAITAGRMPCPDAGLGPRTMVALRLVAAEHPEATMDSILAAHAAFTHEHR